MLATIHHAQLLSYLKMTGFQLGLLINFNVPILKQGIKRMILTMKIRLFFYASLIQPWRSLRLGGLINPRR